MTEPGSPTDEQLSAYLDGELAPDEATAVEARLAADGAARDRLDALARAAAAVAAPVTPPPAAVRSKAVAVAMAAAASGATGDGAVAPVVDVARRRRWSTAILSAAAVLVVLALAVPLLRGAADPDEDAGTAASGPVAEDRAGGGAAEATQDLDTAGAGAAAGADAIPDLGEVSSTEELAAVTRDALPAPSVASHSAPGATTEAGDGGGDESAAMLTACDELTPEDVGVDGTRSGTATATYRGTPVVVQVFDTDDGRRLVVAVDAGACAVLAGPVPLAP